MSLLDYVIHQQCYSISLEFNGIEASDPMGCCLSKKKAYTSRDENEKLIFSEYRRSRPLFDPWGSSTNLETGRGDVHPPEGEGQEGVQVLVVDLRAETDSSNNHIIQIRRTGNKNIECQTDSAEGVDFDWDLSDKTDIETQTQLPSRVPSSKPAPSDAIVQTDQRIVFRGSPLEKAKSTQINTSISPEPSSRKDAFVQTIWDTQDIGIQVLPGELDEGEGGGGGWDKMWRGRGGGGGVDVHSIATQVYQVAEVDAGQQVDLGALRALAAAPGSDTGGQSTPVGLGQHKSLHLDDDLDESLRKYTAKSSTSHHSKTSDENSGSKMDAGVQTESEVNIAAMNGYGVVPPVDPKDVYLGPEGQPLLQLVDDHVQEIESKSVKNIQKLVKYLLEVVEQVPKYRSKRELIAVRSFYTWITRNIRYDPGYMEDDLQTADILMKKAGVCRHYVKLFTEMCTLADIKNQSIQGFARKTDFKPGDEFDENSEVHAWCGVYIDGSWRLVDPTFGAGSYDHTTGEFTQSQDEFYFLTDPNQLIYSHLPYHPLDSDYHIWQLLAQPISLQQFNALPFLTSEFFQMKLKLLTDVSCPWIIYNNDKIEILSSIVVHYRFKLYPAGEKESENLNHYCYHQCENENRSKATFLIQPPIIDSYIFRLFAKPESQIVDEFTRLELICSFLIQADKVLPSIQPWPRNDTAWGFNSEYFKLGCTLVVEDPGKWDGSSIIMTLGSKVSFKFLHRIPLMASAHLYDNKGNEIIEDTKIGTLYIISRKNPLPGSVIQEEAALSRGVHTLVKKKETLFTIISPNNAGFYKMEIYAAKSPKIKGIKMIIPIVASFLVEVRLGQAGDAILQSKSLDALHTFPLKLPPINNIRSKMNNKPWFNQSISQDDVSLPELNKMAALQPDENFREKEESRRSSIWNPLSLFSAVSSRKPSVAPEHLVNHGRF